MIYATEVTTLSELEQILDLQRQNLKQNISGEEKNEQGFVTMTFTLPMLEAMHAIAPSVIVKEDDHVIAYAIVFLKEGRPLFPHIEPMFLNFEKLNWKDKPLNSYPFYIIGQVCVEKKYRGKGVFDLLYQKHRALYQDRFDFLVTEISTTNYRSLKAHQRTGFQTIATHRDLLDEWAVVLWDWHS